MIGWKSRCILPLVFLTCSPLWAKENIDKLTEAYQEAESKWYESMENPESVDWKTHPVREYMPRFRKIAQAEAGKAAAFDALLWMLMNSQPLRAVDGDEETEKLCAWAMERLIRDHVSDVSFEDLKTRLQFLAFNVNLDHLVPYYEAIMRNSKDRESRAYATFNLAAALFSPFSRRGMLPDPKRLKADRQRAKTLFYEIKKTFDETKAAKAADPFIFEIEHLQVGHQAPEIIGTGADGKEIKLSQFQGQVVLLDFWGFW
ncbi:MAG: peroxiredoxin family protein [Phycisphaerae bacterium]